MKLLLCFTFHILCLLFKTTEAATWDQHHESLTASTSCPDNYFYCALGDGCCPCDEPKHPMCLACLHATGGRVASGECTPKEELVCPQGSEVIPGDGSVECTTPLFCDESDCCCECEPGMSLLPP